MRRNIGIQFQSARAHGKMAGVDGNGKVRAATLLIGSINFGIDALIEMDTRRGYEMSARRKSKHSDFVRIDVPFHSMKANQADCPLGIFQSDRRLRVCPQ